MIYSRERARDRLLNLLYLRRGVGGESDRGQLKLLGVQILSRPRADCSGLGGLESGSRRVRGSEVPMRGCARGRTGYNIVCMPRKLILWRFC